MVMATKTRLYSIAGLPFFIAFYLNTDTATGSIFRSHGFAALNRNAYLPVTKQIDITILSPIYNPCKNPEGVDREDTFSTNEIYNSHDDRSTLRRYTNVTIERHVDLLTSSYWRDVWSMDVSTLGDLVRNQYRSLPYPAVDQNQLSKEKDYYYSRLRNYPMYIWTHIGLEAINHFLYNGTNDFM